MKNGSQSFELTRDMIAAARAYLPLAEKAAFAADTAAKCCDVASAKISIGDTSELMVPDMRVENPALRQRYLMGALYAKYFMVSFEPVEGTDCLLSQDDYDRAAATFPLNQLERFKSDAAIRDKVFNLIRDYKDLERMVSAEINNTLAINNDVVMRLALSLSMSITPEALQQLSNAENELKERAASLRESVSEAQQAIKERKDAEGATA